MNAIIITYLLLNLFGFLYVVTQMGYDDENNKFKFVLFSILLIYFGFFIAIIYRVRKINPMNAIKVIFLLLGLASIIFISLYFGKYFL